MTRRHSPGELISLLAPDKRSATAAMTNGMPVSGGPWEQQPRVAFGQDPGGGHPIQASRIQMGDLHGHDPDCNPVEDQSEGFSGARLDGHQQKKKEFRRAWREEWKSKHKWVYPIKNADGEVRLKCSWCSLCNMDNVFAREGCSTIQMSALNTHAKSEAHKAAESRMGGSDMSLATLALPDNFFDGCRNGAESGSRDSMGQMDADAATPGKKRKLMPINKGDTLGSILQKNNNRIVQLLLGAETGRNTRHATNVALAKKQLKLEEQRLQVEQHLLEQDKETFNAHVNLGQSFIAALTDIGEGLKKIGNAMEARKTLL